MGQHLNFKAILFDFAGTLFAPRNVVKPKQVTQQLQEQGVEIKESKVKDLCAEYLATADS